MTFTTSDHILVGNKVIASHLQWSTIHTALVRIGSSDELWSDPILVVGEQRS